MDPKKWGSSAWHVLHRISYQKQLSLSELEQFYMSLEYILPCTECRDNIKRHIVNLPFPRRRAQVPRWVYDLHNRVNLDLGKNMSKVPPFVDIKASQFNVVRIQKELPFIIAIAKTHPGKREITSQEVKALSNFIEVWSGDEVNIDVSSRAAFRAWALKVGLAQIEQPH